LTNTRRDTSTERRCITIGTGSADHIVGASTLTSSAVVSIFRLRTFQTRVAVDIKVLERETLSVLALTSAIAIVNDTSGTSIRSTIDILGTSLNALGIRSTRIFAKWIIGISTSGSSRASFGDVGRYARASEVGSGIVE